MYILKLLSFFLFPIFLFAQKPIIIIDKAKKKPVPFVSIYNDSLGTISNEEGYFKIPLAMEDSLTISSIGYHTIRINKEQLQKLDTLFLIPQTVALNEVTVYSTNLKEKLQYVLDNYQSLYIKGNALYDMTYKEIFRVNDTLRRLFQCQLQLWDENYEIDFEKPIFKQNHIKLLSTDYSRKQEYYYQLSDAYVMNEDALSKLHLNLWCYFIQRIAKDIAIKYIEKTETTTKIVFSAKVFENNKKLGVYKDNYIVLDNKSQAIIEFYQYLVYDNHIQKGFSEKEKKTYEINNKHHIISISLQKDDMGKYRIKKYKFELVGFARIERQEYNNISFSQEFYVTGLKHGGEIPKKDRIDLNESIYSSLIKTPKKDLNILLTKEEQDFIKEHK